MKFRQMKNILSESIPLTPAPSSAIENDSSIVPKEEILQKMNDVTSSPGELHKSPVKSKRVKLDKSNLYCHYVDIILCSL